MMRKLNVQNALRKTLREFGKVFLKRKARKLSQSLLEIGGRGCQCLNNLPACLVIGVLDDRKRFDENSQTTPRRFGSCCEKLFGK
jgi:hypothetical protein